MGAEEERATNQQAAENPVEVPSSDGSDADTYLERIIEGANFYVVQGLNVYRLHPQGLTRSELFAHMIVYRENNHKS